MFASGRYLARFSTTFLGSLKISDAACLVVVLSPPVVAVKPAVRVMMRKPWMTRKM